MRSPFFWLVIVVFGWFAYTILSGNLYKVIGVGRKPPSAHKQKEIVQEEKKEIKNDEQSRQEIVENDKRCITKDGDRSR